MCLITRVKSKIQRQTKGYLSTAHIVINLMKLHNMINVLENEMERKQKRGHELKSVSALHLGTNQILCNIEH